MSSAASGAGSGKTLWRPSTQRVAEANITRYLTWLRETRGTSFETYNDLWLWSVNSLEAFWQSIWDFGNFKSYRPYNTVLDSHRMPGAHWFAGAELNYSERVLERRDAAVAIMFCSELRPLASVTYQDLHQQVAAIATGLRRLGVRRGDRVAAYMPNIPETIIAFLATASLGAIWSCCSPDFGPRAVLDRFEQIEPRVLLAVDGYQYAGKAYNRLDVVKQLQAGLPSLQATVLVPYLALNPNRNGIKTSINWEQLGDQPAQLEFEPVPFEHPLWIVYTSGTTGLPKAIVHSHGGILLEQFKAQHLQWDLGSGDRFFWFGSTAWVVWNQVVSALMHGGRIVIYDGSPLYPDVGTLWQLASDTHLTFFGVSAPFILTCMKAGLEPGRLFNFEQLRTVGSTAAPLPPDGFRWIYDKVKRDILLASMSGGTDVCTSFVGPCPLLPVTAGEIQCRQLGVAVRAYDENGTDQADKVGELVVTEPMPSMPLHFWNDPEDRRYIDAYFGVFPGAWRHGDWIRISSHGTCVVTGRSDSTLKRGGIRIGTSEVYRVVEAIEEILDSLIIERKTADGSKLLLFVVTRNGAGITSDLRGLINQQLRQQLSPRHVPDDVIAVPEIPRTLNGKKLEIPIARILSGSTIDEALSLGTVGNPDAVRFFVDLAAQT
jgi:acetoacetyl-CoA synthetase